MHGRKISTPRPPPPQPKADPRGAGGARGATGPERFAEVQRRLDGPGSFASRLASDGDAPSAHSPGTVGIAPALSDPARALVNELVDLGLLTGSDRPRALRVVDPAPHLVAVEDETRPGREGAAEAARTALPLISQPGHAKAALLAFRQAYQDRLALLDPVLTALRQELASVQEGPALWSLTHVLPAQLDFRTARGLAVARLLNDPGLRTKGYVAAHLQLKHWVQGLHALDQAGAVLANAARAQGALAPEWAQQLLEVKRALPRLPAMPTAPGGALEGPQLRQLQDALGERQEQARRELVATGRKLREIESRFLRESLAGSTR